MMPVAGTPILVHLMRIYASQGFRKFILAGGHRKEILSDYFDGRFKDWDVRIVDTGETSDTGERLRRCAPFAGELFFATYGDGIGNVDLNQLLDVHVESGAQATLTAVPLRSQYGTVVFSREGRVQQFQEKPVIKGCWVNAGFFVFENKVFDLWPGENLESDILPALAASGALHTNLHEGFWRSMDTSKDQQEIESLYNGGDPPWMNVRLRQRAAVANGQGQPV